MKKQLPLAVSLLVAFIGARAQKSDTAWLIVHYKFAWVWDTANRAKPYTENMALFIGKRASAYVSWDGLVADRQFIKAYAEAQASNLGGQPQANRSGAGLHTQYFQYPGEQKLFTKEYVMASAYLIESVMPDVGWKISSDTATFGGLYCQKATGRFKGRNYIVWFCPTLPVHTGPWKLNGLPGVIVDAHDEKNEVAFNFDGVEKTYPMPLKGKSITGDKEEKDLPPIMRGLNYDPNLIVPPTTAIKTTQKDFDRLRDGMRKNPGAYTRAEASSRAGSSADHVIVAKKGNALSLTISNPMELPEK